ncbi:RNA 2'-phosphotransferase [Vibrio gazogenes]|uniref:Probable RNA 2'-phosphotransferase n=1 Tax=Vibrio gazogenes TaxID=687 RepID=A0A1Z2SCE0_VIBGA|nr:RNA 2'-phosphotransferase [Vibrio gazogenes]ASA54846.1 RNA 2'-phosphotransferase [Vibrio gazogenes]
MTSQNQLKQISKFLSFVLRHKPEAIDLTLDPHGWANIDELIDKASTSNEIEDIDRNLIQDVVDTNDKKRFIISEDGQHIRANQGHSIHVDLQLQPSVPPEFLYHGTATRFLDSILEEGLKPQQRQHVHLSADKETAVTVGQRYGKPVILKIKSQLMYEQGFEFYISENGVWLTSYVPSKFIIDKCLIEV